MTKAISHPLFGDPQDGCRRADLSLPRQLDERADLIGAERGDVTATPAAYTDI